MARTAIERYRQHDLWQALKVKRAALESARFSTESLERQREEVLSILEAAARSKDNPVPALYDDVLDQLRDTLNQLGADEGSFSSFANGSYYSSTRDLTRRLPGPPPRQVNDRYLAALDAAITAREEELDELRKTAAALKKEVDNSFLKLEDLSTAIEQQQTKIAGAAATITQVVSSAEEQLAGEWGNRLDAWENSRTQKDKELDTKLETNIGLLAAAASVGQRLVEHAAGQLTATQWTGRATRERKNAIWLRLGSFAAFLAALTVGGYILWHAIDAGFELTVGDGILRGALVLALVGVGSFLSAESRRHFKEADSAEDVSLALTTIEPFYAGATEEARTTARDKVGDTIFVKNTLSRFSSRDAAKHTAINNQQMSEIVELLTKSADFAKKAGA